MQTDHSYPAARRHVLPYRWVGGAARPNDWQLTTGAGPLELPSEEIWAFDTERYTLGLFCRGRDVCQAGKTRLSWPIRNQNSQPTCVAEAVVACIELMRANNKGSAGQGASIERLSVRFLYQQMRKRGENSKYEQNNEEEWNRGFTSLANAETVLKDSGICSEEAWSDSGYLLAPPSEAAKRQARELVFKKEDIDHKIWVTQGQREKICPVEATLKVLKDKRPVAIALPAFAASSTDNLSTNWNRESVLLTGNVQDPLEGEEPVDNSGHAICVIGFLPDQTTGLGDDYFVFRNSLGEDFASLPPPSVLARGYGKISATHVAKHCWELLALRLP